jgi:hypothetical protein
MRELPSIIFRKDCFLGAFLGLFEGVFLVFLVPGLVGVDFLAFFILATKAFFCAGVMVRFAILLPSEKAGDDLDDGLGSGDDAGKHAADCGEHASPKGLGFKLLNHGLSPFCFYGENLEFHLSPPP